MRFKRCAGANIERNLQLSMMMQESYWRLLKKRLKDGDIQLVTNCNQLNVN